MNRLSGSVRVGPERRAVPIAGRPIESDGFGLPDARLQTDTFNVPLAGRIFQRLQQPPPYPMSAGFRTHEHAFYFGVPRRDDPKGDRSEKFSVTARGEKNRVGCCECIHVHDVIAFGWIQCLQVRAQLGDDAPHVRLPRIFGLDADLRLAHPRPFSHEA